MALGDVGFGGGRAGGVGTSSSVEEEVVTVVSALYRLAEVLAVIAMVAMVFGMKLWTCSLSKWRIC
jgi:hypothetical protein